MKTFRSLPVSPKTCPASLWRLAAGFVFLSALLAGGCSRQPTRAALQPQLPSNVLDYRNGWYCRMNGEQTIEQLSRHYQRDPALVALLNRLQPNQTPACGTMIYMPPSNDRQAVRQVLEKIALTPQSVPKVPYDRLNKKATPGLKTIIETKTAQGSSKTKVGKESRLAIVEGIEKPGKSGGFFSRSKPPENRDEVKIASAKPSPGYARPKKTASSPKTSAPAAPAKSSPPAASAKSSSPKPAATSKASTSVPKGPDGPFAWPLEGEVVTRFKDGWSKACHGIEIAVARAAEVHAAREGKVLLAQEFPGYGNMILIDHEDGFASVYGYNDKMLVKENQRVHRGQTIARVDAGARNKRFFFQIRRNAQPVDPMQYLAGK